MLSMSAMLSVVAIASALVVVSGHFACHNAQPTLSQMVTGVHIDTVWTTNRRSARSVGGQRLLNNPSFTQGIRISPYFDQSLDNDPELANFIKAHIRQTTNFWRQTVAARNPTSEKGALLLDWPCVDGEVSYCRSTPGLAFCTSRCDPNPLCGPTPIPTNHLRTCREVVNGSCAPFGNNVDKDKGLLETDFVLYVSLKATDQCTIPTSLAYASFCQLEADLDRPIAGYINFCPSESLSAKARQYRNKLSPSFGAIIKHEMVHALGFTSSLFAFYRSAVDGSALTPRNSVTQLPTTFDSRAQLYRWSNKTVTRIARRNWMTRSGPMTHWIDVVVTPAVQRVVRDHFQCPSLEGAELENQGGLGTAMTHWEKRIFQNELLTGVYMKASSLSNVTLALLFDTGWYLVDFRRASSLQFGRALGCDFVNNSCLHWMLHNAQRNMSIQPFCNQLRAPVQTNLPLITGCSPAADSVVACNLIQHKSQLPAEYQYFSDAVLGNIDEAALKYAGISLTALGGATSLADYCPFFQEVLWTNSAALDGETGPDRDWRGLDSSGQCGATRHQLPDAMNLALEAYGPDSACLLQKERFTRIQLNKVEQLRNWGSGCYEVVCSTGGNAIDIYGPLGRLLGTCVSSTQVLPVTFRAHQYIYNGSLLCPRCSVVCARDADTTVASFCHSYDGVAPTTQSGPFALQVSFATNYMVDFVGEGRALAPSPRSYWLVLPIQLLCWAAVALL